MDIGLFPVYIVWCVCVFDKEQCNHERFYLLFQGTWVSFSGEHCWECNGSQVCRCSAFLSKALFSKVIVLIYTPNFCQHLVRSDFHVFTNLVCMTMYFIIILTYFSLICNARRTLFMCIGQPIFHF